MALYCIWKIVEQSRGSKPGSKLPSVISASVFPFRLQSWVSDCVLLWCTAPYIPSKPIYPHDDFGHGVYYINWKYTKKDSVFYTPWKSQASQLSKVKILITYFFFMIIVAKIWVFFSGNYWKSVWFATRNRQLTQARSRLFKSNFGSSQRSIHTKTQLNSQNSASHINWKT